MDNVKRWLTIYWEQANEKGPHLEDFVRSLVAGEHGPCPPEALRAFLEAVEANLVENIENKAQAGGPWAMMKDQVIAETHEEIADLMARYAAG